MICERFKVTVPMSMTDPEFDQLQKLTGTVSRRRFCRRAGGTVVFLGACGQQGFGWKLAEVYLYFEWRPFGFPSLSKTMWPKWFAGKQEPYQPHPLSERWISRITDRSNAHASPANHR